MPPKTIIQVLVCISLLIDGGNAAAQRMLINTGNDIYELTGGIGSCTYKNIGHFCLDENQIFSIALHKDTLYIVTPSADLYQVNLSSPGSCKYLTSFPVLGNAPGANITCLTSDKNGILYAVESLTKGLFRYDPHTNELDLLGDLPMYPAGDLSFYKDTLLYTGLNSTIYAVDLDQPSASTAFMATPGYSFYGLIAVPEDCTKTRLFGVDIKPLNQAGDRTHLVEIDPVTRTISGVVCSIPYDILDAASSIEDGSNGGVAIDSLAVLAACGGNNTGSLQVFASSAPDGTTYILDGLQTNTTGIFPDVSIGSHSIHIQASPACFADSTFILNKGLSDVRFQVTGPQDCTHADGSIGITGSSGSPPILYSLNGGPPQASPFFNSLTAGQYTLSITDAGHCEKDTSVILSYQHGSPFPADITINPATCVGKSGSIILALTGNTDPSTISASLNNGAIQSSLSFPGLDAGSYTLHVYNTNGCRYDSILSVAKKIDPEPVIRADIQNQQCFFDNGHIYLSVSGADGPYLSSLNSSAYTPNLNYDGLAPATYMVSIQDKNSCSWDTSFLVQPYPKDAITLSIDTVNPVCSELNSGSLTIRVEGDQSPYWLGFNNTTYANGGTIGHLNYGDYSLPVINQDGCVVDSAHVHLELDLRPECDNVYIPNAFTPDGNGVNDLFRVVHSPYLTQVGLRVYNRYGQLLFTSSEQRPGWDGTFHGEAQPSGTYVWTVDYTDLEKRGKQAHGTVLLVR